jgi:hypothetical protein
MKLRMIVGLLVLMMVAVAVDADCNYYTCFVSETSGTCSVTACFGSGCYDPNLIFAQGCYVTCNRGGCWCTGQAHCYHV